MKCLLIAISCIFVTGCELSKAQVLDEVQDNVKRVGIHSSNQSQSDTARMSIQEEFSLVYQSLKETRVVYNADVMKTLAFLIIALGWFITSDKSRNFFRGNRAARISSIFAVVVTCVIHVRASVLTYLSSQKLNSLLGGMNYLDSEHYSCYGIDIMQLVTNLIQNVALFGVLIVVLFSLKDVVTKSDTAGRQ